MAKISYVINIYIVVLVIFQIDSKYAKVYDEQVVRIAKAIILNQFVLPADTDFERQTKSLVSNFLVSTAIDLESAAKAEENLDYDEVSSTTQKVFTWPPFFVQQTSTSKTELLVSSQNVSGSSLSQLINARPSTPMTNHSGQNEQTEDFMTTQAANTTRPNSEATTPSVEMESLTVPPPKTKPPRGLIGAIQYLTLIVPDALRPGRNTTSLLNGESVTSILKIIGSVAFLNLSGVIDNSVKLGTSNPVRELVFGVTNLVFCNPVIVALNTGRCSRQLMDGEPIGNILNYAST